MREQYLMQLKKLHEAMLEMGELCQQAIGLAIRALGECNDALIAQEQETDSEIDKLEREIESLCLQLLLKQQPVASDLRDISAALKMISDMERIGDQASDIAELAVYLKELPVHYKLHLEQMAAEAIKMVNRSIDAFVRRDLTLAGEVIAYDDVVDQYFVQIKDEVIALISKDNTMGAYCIDLLMVAKYLERIADHATNIAEWVEYSILGRRPKDGVLPQSEL